MYKLYKNLKYGEQDQEKEKLVYTVDPVNDYMLQKMYTHKVKPSKLERMRILTLKKKFKERVETYLKENDQVSSNQQNKEEQLKIIESLNEDKKEEILPENVINLNKEEDLNSDDEMIELNEDLEIDEEDEEEEEDEDYEGEYDFDIDEDGFQYMIEEEESEDDSDDVFNKNYRMKNKMIVDQNTRINSQVAQVNNNISNKNQFLNKKRKNAQILFQLKENEKTTKNSESANKQNKFNNNLKDNNSKDSKKVSFKLHSNELQGNII